MKQYQKMFNIVFSGAILWFVFTAIFILLVCSKYGFSCLINELPYNYTAPRFIAIQVAYTGAMFFIIPLCFIILIVSKIEYFNTDKTDCISDNKIYTFLFLVGLFIYFFWFDSFDILHRFYD